MTWTFSAAPAAGDLPMAYLARFTMSPLTEEGRHDPYRRPGETSAHSGRSHCPGPGRPPPSAGRAADVAEHERHRLARELHDGAIQEVLAAGLAIDLCLADTPAESPMHASLEHARAAHRDGRPATAVLAAEPPRGRDRPRRRASRHAAAPQGPCIPQLASVSVDVTGAPVPLAEAVSRSLFQMASECVFNAAVHGRARRAVIGLSYGSGV